MNKPQNVSRETFWGLFYDKNFNVEITAPQRIKSIPNEPILLLSL